MPWYPAAVRKQLTVPNRAKHKVRMASPRRINLHTAVSNGASIFGFFNSAGARGVFSHFYVRADGTVEQYQDTDFRAACDLDGNPDTISVETWDGYRSGFAGYWRHDSDVPPWTGAQLASLAALVRWIFAAHPSVPRRMATDNRRGVTSHGLSWHRLGVLGAPGYIAPTSGGLRYSTSRGKICPGPLRIGQVRSIYAAAISGTTPPGLPSSGVNPTPSKPAPTATPGGLTMSDAARLEAILTSDKSGLPYLSAQIKSTAQMVHDKTGHLAAQNRAIADGSFGRDAITARNADTARIVERVVTSALQSVPGVDMGKLSAAVKAATKEALAEAEKVDAGAKARAVVDELAKRLEG